MLTQTKTIAVDSLDIFYRQAGSPNAPAILLLHGFPTSSHQYRNLIPLLAERYFVIAPDLPGFGFSSAPSAAEFSYTFDHLSEVMERFTEAIGLERFALFVFDYGAPVGWRLALQHPERIIAIISQNGNAYEDGLSEAWNPLRQYWNEPTPANREALRSFLTFDSTKFQYLHGTPDGAMIAPETYYLDQALLDRAGNADIQLDLFLDYRNNIALYPKVHDYFRQQQPPLLAVWGKNDPFFLPEGAEAFQRDNPTAQCVFFDTGHFALETHLLPISTHILQFLGAVTAA